MEQSIDILLLFVRALGCFGTFALLGWRACSLAVSVSLSLGLTAFMVPLLLVGARGEPASILADVVLRPTLLLDAPPSLIAGNLVVGIIAGAVGSAAVAVFLFLSGWIQELVFPALRSSSERPLSPALGTLFVLFPLALLFEAGGGASLLGAVAEALRAAPPRSPWGLLSASSVLTGAGASALKVAALVSLPLFLLVLASECCMLLVRRYAPRATNAEALAGVRTIILFLVAGSMLAVVEQTVRASHSHTLETLPAQLAGEIP